MRIELAGNELTVEQVLEVALGGAEVRLHAEAHERMEASRAVVERMLESGKAVYGVNTGFGKLAEKRIEPDQIRQLQVNLVRSHACGVGAALMQAKATLQDIADAGYAAITYHNLYQQAAEKATLQPQGQ